MATWATTITVKDLHNKIISVTGVRTDGEDVRTYTLSGNIDMTGRTLVSLRDEIVDRLWKIYQADIDKETNIATLISGYENALNTALDALES